MKFKTLIVAFFALIAAVSCSARDSYSHDVTVLPKEAQDVLAKHFPKHEVSHIKIDKHTFGGADYDVVLTDGTEIDFDNDGKIDEIDCGRKGQVPKALIAAPVMEYVVNHYPHQNVIKYDVKKNGYEVELQSGVELVFNKKGEFQRIDD